MTVLIESHYLPCIAYFAAAAGKVLRLEKHEHFIKQTYRNRCYINTDHGTDSLNVPLKHDRGKSTIAEVRIDHTQKWVNNHWRTIVSAYGKSPFFEFYCDGLEKVLFRKHEFLYDLNFELLTLCLTWVDLGVRLEETQKYEMSPELHDVTDLRGVITPKVPGNIRQVYRPERYQQVFGNAFVENQSLIDLIFCCGPEAGRIVRASSVME